jgi:hypothetical protein
MDESWVLIDADTGLHVSWYFWLRVLDEVNRSARYGAPFALLLGEVEVADARHPKPAEEAMSCVALAIRSTDLGGVLGTRRVGVLLTHQDVPAAELARTRILERLDGLCPKGVAWRTQLLCYPDHAATISTLLTAGWTELQDHLGFELERPA